MDVSRVIDAIRSLPGVLSVHAMDRGLVETILEEESEMFSNNIEVCNQGLEEVLARDAAVCVFCNGDFQGPDEGSGGLCLMSSEGELMGKELTSSEIGQYRDRTDVVWLSDDFVMFSEVSFSGTERFVLFPKEYKGVSEEDGARNAVLCYPATTSDMILRRAFGVKAPEGTASAIIAFDLAFQ
jgi:hypothetical protein